jgi:hypothetical protein
VSWIAQVTKWIWKETSKTVLPIVQAVDEPEPLNPREFRHVLKTALTASGSQGAIIFNLSALSPGKVGVVREVFSEMGAR